MAILEFEFKGIDQNFRSSAANVLKDIDKIKSAFSGIGGGSVDVSGLKKGMDEVRASIKLAESDNKMFLATILDFYWLLATGAKLNQSNKIRPVSDKYASSSGFSFLSFSTSAI